MDPLSRPLAGWHLRGPEDRVSGRVDPDLLNQRLDLVKVRVAGTRPPGQRKCVRPNRGNSDPLVPLRRGGVVGDGLDRELLSHHAQLLERGR